mmetsp:Transcript_23040/g.45343  ORF Transcript_23040/g.45343 Transcript_23040/m.45343 type:complete len:162 (-) Transcript_23040:35-520(-)
MPCSPPDQTARCPVNLLDCLIVQILALSELAPSDLVVTLALKVRHSDTTAFQYSFRSRSFLSPSPPPSSSQFPSPSPSPSPFEHSVMYRERLSSARSALHWPQRPPSSTRPIGANWGAPLDSRNNPKAAWTRQETVSRPFRSQQHAQKDLQQVSGAVFYHT